MTTVAMLSVPVPHRQRNRTAVRLLPGNGKTPGGL
jgi:hypothetical protein